jgi:MOSC domain-containing protein YiiM
MPKPIITGLYYGGVDNLIAPDGRPLVTGIRKRPAAAGFLGTNGFPDDASAEPDHHTQDRTVHLFSNENYLLLEARLGVVLPSQHSVRISRRPRCWKVKFMLATISE